MDVFFYELFEEEAEALKAIASGQFSFDFTGDTIQEFQAKLPPARLISIRTQSVIPDSWAKDLDGVLSRSTGYDHLVKFRERTQTAIPLGYLDEYATTAVAEHAIITALALLRKLPQQQRQFSKFCRDGLTGFQARGRKLLVVGMGRIGYEIAAMGRALAMEVRGVDIVQNKPDIDFVEPVEGIRWAEIIICAMNLTSMNAGYFNYNLLSQANSGCLFVNIARGELSPLQDLEKLLKEGRLSGIGLDVFDDEAELSTELRSGQGTSNNYQIIKRLLDNPSVILTPHNAFNATETVTAKGEMTVRQILHFFNTGRFLWQL